MASEALKPVARVKQYEDVDGDTQFAIHWLTKRRLPHGTDLYLRPAPSPELVREIAEVVTVALIDNGWIGPLSDASCDRLEADVASYIREALEGERK